MKTNGDIPTLLRRLETLNADLRDRPRQTKQTEKELLFVYDDLTAAYLDASPEQRVDSCVALEFRAGLVNCLLTYYKNMVAQVSKGARKKRQDQTFRQSVQQAAATRALIGRKIPIEDIEELDLQFQEAADAAGVDVSEMVDSMEPSYKFFVQRALQYYKAKDRIRALKALGIAMQKNPALENNDRVLALAATLTGETEFSAIVTMSDAYVLRKFVEELERAQLAERVQMEPQSRSTLDVIRSWFAS